MYRSRSAPRLPLVLADGTLIAAADLWIDESVRAAPGARHRGRLVWLQGNLIGKFGPSGVAHFVIICSPVVQALIHGRCRQHPSRRDIP